MTPRTRHLGAALRRSLTTRPIALLAAAAVLAAGMTVPVVLAATPNRILPTQRIDVKVLLLSADGTEPGFGAWKAQLAREGVPYDAIVAYSGSTKVATLTDDKLADYGANHAKYDAVILTTGDLGHTVNNPGGTTSFLSALTDVEWDRLARFERTFGIRQLSDYTAPTPAHGLNTVGGATQDGSVGTLTPAGRAAFPYLKGTVPIANDDPTVAEAFGYVAAPTSSDSWQTLLTGPGNTGAYLGIYTHPDDGREEMVITVASNENQSHAQLLRHGELNWVTRGVFLGYQRNYLELQVDDLFLGDDAWNPATHSTDYDPATASRMTSADLAQAVTWSKSRGLRLDFAFNGGGSVLYAQEHGGSDPLAAAFADDTTRATFGYVNHTYDHPNLDCSTSSFITKELRDNVTWGQQHALPLDPSETVTGEHSGLANSRPGNPGTIDPPFFDALTPATTGGTLAIGSYDYAITAQSPAGETTASITPGVATTTATSSVTATFDAVCHAVKFNLYRSAAGANSWSLVGSATRGATDPTDNGASPTELTIVDTGAAGAAAALPTSNGAALTPYAQNPNYLVGLINAGIKYVATDASKTYPTDPLNLASTPYAQGAAFGETGAGGGFQTFPRYPTNVYYNASRQSQQLDEYNWIYVLPANGGGCVPIAGLTTCRTTAATWADYVNSENTIMFRHVMGNDPRPHYMHQSNLADYNPALVETDPSQGGVLYAVVDPLLTRYDTYFERGSAPLVQLTSTQIAQTMARQDTWAAELAAGKVTAWLQDGELHVKNSDTAAADVPLTGTTVGDAYGGQKSGWTTIAAGTERVFEPNDPANITAPIISGSARVGERLTAGKGSWSGTPTVEYAYQWQRCNADGRSCDNIAGARTSTYDVTSADSESTLRVVVSAGNWISSVSQAPSAATDVIGRPKAAAGSQQQGASKTAPATVKASRLSLTKLKMSPRRFALAHKKKRKGTRLDGSRITWKLNKAATVSLTFQRLGGTKKHSRWVSVGTIKRSAKKGTGTVRFTGRFGKKLLAPRGYRLVATAIKGREKTAAKHVSFKVIRG
jgi:hypothetical protein